MARKRMLANGIWHDRKCIRLSNEELLVWIGCISLADDEGIFEADPLALHYELARRTITPDDMEDILAELDKAGLIVRYGDYAFIPAWFKHQKLKGRSPQETNHRRPPRGVLEKYPAYVKEWELTFSKGDTTADYPFDTCDQHCATTAQEVDQDCAIDAQAIVPKRREGKGREEKSSIAAENGSRGDEPVDNSVDNSEAHSDPFDDLPDLEPEAEPEPKKPPSEHQQLVDAAMALHEQATGSKYAFSGEDGKHLQQVRKKLGVDEAMTRLRRYYTGEYWFTEDGQYSIRQFHRHVNELAANGARASPTPEDRAAARKEYLARMYPERYGQEVAT
jgi:hypothetical protein